jgi:hypothetical protein
MLQQWEMDAYHKHITALSDTELDKEYESCKSGTGGDPWYTAACYTERKRRATIRALEHEMR